jgi:hypothetical protein
LLLFFAIKEWKDSAETKLGNKLVSGPIRHFFGDMPAAVTGILIFTVWMRLGHENMDHFSVLDYQTLFMPWLLMAAVLVVWFIVALSIFFRNQT